MLARVRTAALWGMEAFPVECEVDVGPGLPGFAMVGLPDASGREARERVWPALRNCGFAPPDRKVIANLAPADRRKEGAAADLALALALLVATGQAPPERLERTAALGELALDGRLRGTRGTLSLAEAAWRAGARTLVCAAEAAPEAALVEGLRVLASPGLAEAVSWLRGEDALDLAGPARPDPLEGSDEDLADVRGQAVARRALEIAAAGGHHLLLVGPPGSGKSMLTRRLPGLLPPLEPEEALTVTRLHSACGMRQPGAGAHAPAAVPLAASLRLARGARGRGRTAAAGRAVAGASRRAVPGRTLGVPEIAARCAARAARDRRGAPFARERPRPVSRAAAAGRGDEPVRLCCLLPTISEGTGKELRSISTTSFPTVTCATMASMMARFSSAVRDGQRPYRSRVSARSSSLPRIWILRKSSSPWSLGCSSSSPLRRSSSGR